MGFLGRLFGRGATAPGRRPEETSLQAKPGAGDAGSPVRGPDDTGPQQEPPAREAVLRALDAVLDPASGRGLNAAGLVRGLALKPGRAGFMLEVAPDQVDVYARVRDEAEKALRGVAGVDIAQVVLTTQTAPRSGVPLRETVTRRAPPPPAGPPKTSDAPRTSRPAHVRQVIAVASAKGGVGKSTIAVNLACAFARMGYRTGLLDADVYGPSVPTLLGRKDRPTVLPDKRLQPLEAFGVSFVSIGLLVKEDAPVIWRGPMASGALTQLLTEVAWGEDDRPLDLLLIDMPPGTGDIQLTLAQKIALDGAVIVSTPQELALADVRRGLAMYAKTNTRVLGIIENMAYFPDPTTGTPIEIFGRGGARDAARDLGAPFLGELPLDIALRTGSDAGRPLTACAPESPVAARFMEIAAEIAHGLAKGGPERAPPRIVEVD